MPRPNIGEGNIIDHCSSGGGAETPRLLERNVVGQVLKEVLGMLKDAVLLSEVFVMLFGMMWGWKVLIGYFGGKIRLLLIVGGRKRLLRRIVLWWGGKWLTLKDLCWR